MAAQNVKVRAASLRHGLCQAPEDILKKCIGFVINEASAADRLTLANERLVGAIQKCSEFIHGKNRFKIIVSALSLCLFPEEWPSDI